MNRILFTLVPVAFLVGAILGYYNGPRGPGPVQTVEVERVVEKIVQGEERVRVEYRDRIVTRTVVQKPNGTVITRETERDRAGEKQEERKTTVADKESARDISRTVGASSASSRFSLGVSYWPRYSDLLADSSRFNWERFEIDSGIRVLGPVWLNLGVRTDSVGIGFRWEFGGGRK